MVALSPLSTTGSNAKVCDLSSCLTYHVVAHPPAIHYAHSGPASVVYDIEDDVAASASE